MYIELAEFLRCPRDSGESYCVVASDETAGRQIVRGTIGCPATKREYAIRDGVADFTSACPHVPLPPPPTPPTVDSRAIQALIDISGPGGYVVLVGSAASLSAGLAGLMGGVHLVCLNPPDVTQQSPDISVIRGPHPLPLRSGMARGVVVGSEYGTEPWLGECGRILLKGLRIVVLRGEARIPGVDQLASGDGLWVGQKA
jgi:uncharacterized protein YbaR (Trm112 family)